ncbi:class II glutamine amidotransferase [uncultured Methanobrevibacter sp.]|uniref:class II glutamine amidotransferase n=1 Tax=uncultured Methanobrevibacter sp. TaxID=253161 RepID=UPI0025E60DBF|nr:class II glutamine amidotransferase [uncultured Methanobrevibacter sp.]
MCEIFCFNSKAPKEINKALNQFYNHSDKHPHGWGLANIKSDRYIIDKEPVKASESEKLKKILSKPIIGKMVFAHIRLATIGKLTPSNCHPFVKKDNTGRCWMLMHNGTVFNYPGLEKYQEIQKGSTDSERILLFIIDKVNEFEKSKNALLTTEERFNLITDIISDLSRENKINIMICDGELTYVHTNLKDSLHSLRTDNGLILTSCPLNDDKNWKTVDINKIYGLKDGKIILKSKNHGNEFIFTEKHEEIIREAIKSLDKELYDKLMEEYDKNAMSF